MWYLLLLRQASGSAGLDRLERARQVAALAIPPEAAVVNVHVLVTAHARARDGSPAVHGKLVAGEAIEPAVLAVEGETSAPVVIEVPLFPVARVVAVLAPRTEPELVLVVLAVAGVAVRLGVLVLRRGVVGLALEPCMLAEQREAREPVVEPCLSPAQIV